jgi:hypothetical protein
LGSEQGLGEALVGESFDACVGPNLGSLERQHAARGRYHDYGRSFMLEKILWTPL